jgi:hypothetical protein
MIQPCTILDVLINIYGRLLSSDCYLSDLSDTDKIDEVAVDEDDESEDSIMAIKKPAKFAVQLFVFYRSCLMLLFMFDSTAATKDTLECVAPPIKLLAQTKGMYEFISSFMETLTNNLVSKIFSPNVNRRKRM